MSPSKSKARAKSRSKSKSKQKRPARPVQARAEEAPAIGWSEGKRLLWLRWGAAGGMLLGILLSIRLWTGDRLYPQVPLFPLPAWPVWLGWLSLGLLLAALVLSLYRKQPRPWMWATLAIGGVLMLQDQARIQPWFYYYLSVFLACAWASGREEERAQVALHACRIMVIGVYVWAGLQKMNATFIESVGPWLFQPMTELLPFGLRQGLWLKALIYTVPLLELGIGIGLLFRRTRALAVLAASGMHVAILLFIGPLGHNWNSVVWPWNIAMSVFTFALFWRSDALTFRGFQPKAKFVWLYVFLFLCGPLLNKFDLWDDYLSAKMYAGNISAAYIVARRGGDAGFPKALRKYVKQRTINIENWSLADMNVPAYPAKRSYHKIMRHVCALGTCSMLRLVIKDRPHWRTGKHRLSVYQLDEKSGALRLLRTQVVDGLKKR